MSLASPIAFVVSLAAAALLTPVVRGFALRRRIVDGGGARKVHAKAVPRVGGIAFVAAFFLSVLVALAADPSLREALWERRPSSFMFLGGGLAIALIGLADDLRGLRARYKLALQLIVVGVLCGSGYVVRDVTLPGDVVVHFGMLAVPLTVLWIVGVTNAMNLIDGLDGLAGGCALFALVAAFVLSIIGGKPALAIYSAGLAGAVAGFLFYNSHPATIFMGDTGSLFLGYFLAVGLPIAAKAAGTGVTDGMVPLVVLGLPVADTLLAVARRALRGKGLFSPDRMHIHHRLLDRGYSHQGAVLALYGVCASLAAAGLALAIGGFWTDLAVVALLAFGAFRLLQHLGPFDLRVEGFREHRSRNLALRRAVEAIVASLHQAQDMTGVLASFRELAPAVAATHVVARIGGHTATWPEGTVSPIELPEPLKVRFPVRQGPRRFGELEVFWDGAHHLDLDHALAVEQVCESLARAVRRVSPDAAEPVFATPLPGTLLALSASDPVLTAGAFLDRRTPPRTRD